MKFSVTPFNEFHQFSHYTISENGLVHFGVYKVIFGHRVRAGFTEDLCYNLDWCGGSSWPNVERLYSLLFGILSKRTEDQNCFEGLPTISNVKPFFNDIEFVNIVSKAAGVFELIKLEKIGNFTKNYE